MEYVKNIFEYVSGQSKPTNVAKSILTILEKMGLSFYSDSEGRVYPVSNSSACVVSVLSNKLAQNNAEIMLNSEVFKIEKQQNTFLVFVNNEKIQAKNVLLCCGGSATKLAENLGHKTTGLTKSLVGFKVKENLKQISGVRVSDCIVKINFENNVLKSSHSPLAKLTPNSFEEQGEVIFKDDGVSGICVMNASSIVARNRGEKFSLSLDLLPNISLEKIIQKLIDFNNEQPENMLNCLYGWFAKPLAQWLYSKFKTPQKIANQIKNFQFEVLSTYNNNQVTCGGVDVAELNITESKIINRLYISGEMVNIDGVCGGYNLMFALSSAYASIKQILNSKEHND